MPLVVMEARVCRCPPSVASRLSLCVGKASVALQSGLEWMGRGSLEPISLLFLLCVCVCGSWGGAGGDPGGVVPGKMVALGFVRAAA